MKTIIAVFALIAACSALYHPNPCPDSLCAHKPDGALFGLSKLRPNIFVHCDHGKANCKACPDHQFFSNKFRTCVRRTVKPKCHGHGCKPHPHKPHPHKKCPNSLCRDYKGSKIIVFPYPHKPTYYVQCSNGNSFCRLCPEGLVFNNKIKVCDFPVKKH